MKRHPAALRAWKVPLVRAAPGLPTRFLWVHRLVQEAEGGAGREGRVSVPASPPVLGPVPRQADPPTPTVSPSHWHQPLFSFHGHPLPHLRTKTQPLRFHQRAEARGSNTPVPCPLRRVQKWVWDRRQAHQSLAWVSRWKGLGQEAGGPGWGSLCA